MKKDFEIIFKVDIEKDMQNWWEACNSEFLKIDWKKRTDKKIWKNIHNKSYNNSKKFLKEYLTKLHKENSKLKMFKEEIPKYWKNNKKEFIKNFEKITGKKLYPFKLICYFTSFPRGTKDKKNKWIRPSFLKNKNGKISIKNYFRSIMHELMHIQISHHKLLSDVKLSKKGKINLNESLTVLINYYFYPNLIDKDLGYISHKNLRVDLVKKWKKKENLKDLINQGVNLIKEKYLDLK